MLLLLLDAGVNGEFENEASLICDKNGGQLYSLTF